MWDKRVLSSVSDAAQLPAAVDALLEQQRATWDALRDGERSLRQMPTRPLAGGDRALLLQANVRRRASTFARTDAASIADRPCFLCEVNLPAEERGVAYDDLVIMPNPFPAVADHLTIASREHVVQQLAPRVSALHRLARALGPDRFVLYNGPRCGASAPDHFHFQSGRLESLPVFAHSRLNGALESDVLRAGRRTALRVRHACAEAASAAVARALERLPRTSADASEPMVNVLAAWRDDAFVTLVFPRTRHRPDAFYARSGRLAISPAALEMAGLVIVSDPDQYDAIDADTLEAVFDEVCMPADTLRALWQRS